MSDDGLVNDPRISDADLAVFRTAATGEGAIQITSGDQLMAMADAAGRVFDGFQVRMKDMTREQAVFARKLRVDEGYTWRGVAHTCYVEWQGDWDPPSNQLMGMAICKKAATFFGEDYWIDPWN